MLKSFFKFLFGVKQSSKLDKMHYKYETVKARNKILETEIIKKDKIILHLSKKCLDLELQSK